MKIFRLPKFQTSLILFGITYFCLGYFSPNFEENPGLLIGILLVNLLMMIFLAIHFVKFINIGFNKLMKRASNSLKEKRKKYIFDKIEGKQEWQKE